MTGNVQSQLVGLSVTFLGGAITGAMFDLYRVARWAIRPGKICTLISDIIFWLFAATMVFKFLLIYSWGEVRFYMIAGFGLGFAIYKIIIGRRVVSSAVSTYEYFQYIRRKTIFGFKEGTLWVRRKGFTWFKGCRKICSHCKGVWENIKKRCSFRRKES